jgi:hypothetical protein
MRLPYIYLGYFIYNEFLGCLTRVNPVSGLVAT